MDEFHNTVGVKSKIGKANTSWCFWAFSSFGKTMCQYFNISCQEPLTQNLILFESWVKVILIYLFCIYSTCTVYINVLKELFNYSKCWSDMLIIAVEREVVFVLGANWWPMWPCTFLDLKLIYSTTALVVWKIQHNRPIDNKNLGVAHFKVIWKELICKYKLNWCNIWK